MFESFAGPAVSLLLAGLGGVVWLVRLEGRMNTADKLREAQEKRFAGFEERIYDILERIESKMDRKADK